MSLLTAIKGEFKVTDVSRIKAPYGTNGDTWHSYTIKRGNTEINGCKPGTLRKVTQHAKQVAADLNARCSGKGASPYAAKRRN